MKKSLKGWGIDQLRMPLAKIIFRSGIYFLYSLSFSKTEICGTIKTASDWTKENSPYIITDDLHIPFDSRLSIEAGVVVMVTKPRGECEDQFKQVDWSDSAYTSIKIDGSFFIKGTDSEPVVLMPENFNERQTGWDGIRIAKKTELLVSIRGAEFKGANKALQVESSSFKVMNCLFEWNNNGIMLNRAADIKIINCNFINNRSSGILLNGSRPIILNNIFADNRNYGIWSDSRTGMTIEYNDFWNNKDLDCYKCPLEVLRITGVNANKDSSDRYFNITADPVFIGTKSYLNEIKRDLSLNTDLTAVKDTMIAQMELAYQKKLKKEKPGFKVQGSGKYLLSSYSKLINAGHPDEIFRDRDSTVNDIGMHGGSFK